MVSLAVVLAILTAIGPVLQLNAEGLHILAPLIQQRLMERQKQHGHGNKGAAVNRSVEPPRSCVQFRCAE